VLHPQTNARRHLDVGPAVMTHARGCSFTTMKAMPSWMPVPGCGALRLAI
jgi:hypothetical protein